MFDRSQSTIARVDPDVWAAIQAENRRQEEHIELIASENYTSPAVMAAQAASSPTSTPRATPASATTAAARTSTSSSNWPSTARSSSSARHANVQANSGSQANQAVFFGLLQPGDTIMGMSLADGGHLTTAWRST